MTSASGAEQRPRQRPSRCPRRARRRSPGWSGRRRTSRRDPAGATRAPERIAQPRAAARTSSSPHWPWTPRVLRNQAYFQIKTSKPASTLPSMPCTVAGPCAPLSLAALALAVLVALAPASAAAAPTLKPCRGQDEFGCATLAVPLDRTGAAPGTVALHYAVQREGPRKLLIALSGGPGSRRCRRPRRSRSRWTRRCAATASRCSTSAGPASRASWSAPTCSGCARWTRSAPGGRQLREPHRAAARLLLDGRHGARHRRPAPGARRRQDRADGHLATAPTSRCSTRAPSPSTSTGSSSTRSSAPTGPTPSCSTPTATCRACCASSARTAPAAAHQGPGRRRGRARAAHQRERPAARRLLRRAAASAARRATRRPTSCPSCSSAATSTRSCRPRCPARYQRRAPRRPRAALRLRRIGQGGADDGRGPVVRPQRRHRLRRTRRCPTRARRRSPIARPRPRRRWRRSRPTDYDPFDGADRAAHELRRRLPALGRGDAIRPPFTGPLPDVPALLLGGRLDTRTPLENARATAQELPHSTIVALQGLGPRRARQRHHRLHRAGAGALHRRRRRSATRAWARTTACARRRCRRAR